MPEETTSAFVEASAAEVSRDVGRGRASRGARRRAHRWPSPDAAERHTASVPPTVVAPTAPCDNRGGEVARPPFRASAPNRSSSSRVSPTTISPSSTPTVAGTAPPSRTAASDASPTSTPSPGGKPCATSVVSSATTPRPSPRAHLLGDADHGIAPIFAQQRAAVASAELGSPTRKPAASASPAPVVSTTSTSTAGWSTPSTLRPRAPRLSTHRVASAPTTSCSRSVAKTRPGASAATRARNASSTSVHAETSRETWRLPRVMTRRRVGCGRDRLAGRAHSLEMWSTSRSEPRRLEIAGRAQAVPRSDAIVRSPAAAIETTTPVWPATGPRATPRATRSRRASSPGGIGADAADKCLRTERGSPRGDVRRLAAARCSWSPLVVPRAPVPCRGARRRRAEIADRDDAHLSKLVVWRRGQSPYAVAVVRDRRSRRRGGRARDGTTFVASQAAAPRRPGGLAAFEDAPCFLELVGEEAERYRDGGETSAETSNPT